MRIYRMFCYLFGDYIGRWHELGSTPELVVIIGRDNKGAPVDSTIYVGEGPPLRASIAATLRAAADRIEAAK